MAKKATRYVVTDGALVLTLEVDPDDGGFVVTSPFDPDVLTQADTLKEAFENARDVIALFAEDRAAERAASRAGKNPAPRRKKQKAG